MKYLIILVGLICALTHLTAGAKRVVCVYNSRSVDRPLNGRFTVSTIQPQLCTHLVYGFVGIAPNLSISSLNPSIDFSRANGYLALTSLIRRNNKLVPMVSVGGPQVRSGSFSQAVSTPNNRNRFINSIVAFLRRFNFRGVDFAWQGMRGNDKYNFVALLRELREAFRRSNLRYEITVTLEIATTTVNNSYDLPAIARYVNAINVKSFNINSGRAVSPSAIKAVESVIEMFLKRGAPKNLLVIGVAAYGRSYTLANPEIHCPGAPVSGAGQAGPYTNLRGFLGYNEICALNFTVTYNSEWDTPYGVRNNQWVGFDNPKSILRKCALARRLGLLGGMIWTIDTDDFLNTCRGGRYPLLTAIQQC